MKTIFPKENIELILEAIRFNGGNVRFLDLQYFGMDASVPDIQIYDMEFNKLAVTDLRLNSDLMWGFTISLDGQINVLGTPKHLTQDNGEATLTFDIDRILTTLSQWAEGYLKHHSSSQNYK